jgi:large subunit ribosomal protein L7e
MQTDNFRQPKEKPAQKEKAPAKEKKEDEKKEKKRAFEKGGKKLPAVPESVLKSRKRRDLAKAARLNAAVKVIPVIG